MAAKAISIPVIDLFAGPGGLAEGFSQAGFKVGLSIEMDGHAHSTLRFRAFSRILKQAGHGKALQGFFESRIGSSTLDTGPLQAEFKEIWEEAGKEAMQATLGETPPEEISTRIEAALGKNEKRPWILIGGPPCQAYSLVGRSRMRGTGEKFENDHRHFLYREYLRIVACHAPTIFVMENVKGLLSSSHKGAAILGKIMKDLERPRRTIGGEYSRDQKNKDLQYDLYPLWKPEDGDLFGRYENKDFIVRAEDQGVPQARHRLFIIGIKKDKKLHLNMKHLKPADNQLDAWQVIQDLPSIQSHLSKEKSKGWVETVRGFLASKAVSFLEENDKEVLKEIKRTVGKIHQAGSSGGMVMKRDRRKKPKILAEWYNPGGMSVHLNHESRGHMPTDLHRYLFASVFAEKHGRSPKLEDFPPALLPKHKNVDKKSGKAIFNDRFRVQCKGRPSTTITSHIHKDGHYFIHPDPKQCRSLTVREAARLQTFPDDYLFCGPRTEQFKQVGNAVPPYLAFQIANLMKEILGVR